MPLSKIQGIEGQVTPNLGRRNLIINGAMQVAQRNTSSTDNYYGSVDRYQLSRNATDELVVTQSQDSDNPAGQGFGYSFKVNITTAESALDANENLNFHQRIEGQNLQPIKKGTSNAKSTTVSFWVKSNTTGTYVLELFDNDNSRHAAKTYTIDSANTWEKKIITFVGDTTGALDNDNARSMDVRWWLAAGSNLTSGTLPTGWASLTAANRAVGQVNLMASTNNWYITGIQFEVGDTATDFEHRSFEEELRLCSRYYRKIGRHMGGGREGYSSSAVTFYPGMRLIGNDAANIVTTLSAGGVMYSRGGVNNSTGTLNGTVGISTGATNQAFTASFSHNGASTGSTYNGTGSGFYVDGLTFDAEL